MKLNNVTCREERDYFASQSDARADLRRHKERAVGATPAEFLFTLTFRHRKKAPFGRPSVAARRHPNLN